LPALILRQFSVDNTSVAYRTGLTAVDRRSCSASPPLDRAEKQRAPGRVTPARLALLLAAAMAACRPDNDGIEETLPDHGGLTLAVAPALNFSGSSDLDPVRVADLMASELGDVPGLTILPVSRTLAVLARQGKWQVESPGHALEIARQLGCRAICVPGITEYDPYAPMVIGMAAQLYVLPDDMSPPAGAGMAGDPTSAARAGGWNPLIPRAQVQTVYHSAHQSLADRIKKYAQRRDADQSPFGWRRYMQSQGLFLRFCCWDTGHRLMQQEPGVAGAGNDSGGHEG
jgi:hypothetical protein